MRPFTPDTEPRAIDVACDDRYLHVELADGRRLAIPLDWFPRLHNATPQQRARWRLIGDGEGLHWPDVDEDLSVEGFLRGIRARGSSQHAG